MKVYELANADWQVVIREIRIARRWNYADIARHLVSKCDCRESVQSLSAQIGRLARFEIAEPRVTVAIHLFDLYLEVRANR